MPSSAQSPLQKNLPIPVVVVQPVFTTQPEIPEDKRFLPEVNDGHLTVPTKKKVKKGKPELTDAEKKKIEEHKKKKAEENYGKNRKRVFRIHTAIKGTKNEGIEVPQYKPTFIQEKNIQTYIMNSELMTLENKVFQLIFMLKRGIKKIITDVIKSIPLDCLISLNMKLENLCGLLYEIGGILLQEFQSKPDEIAIRDIANYLKPLKKVKHEIKNFKDVMKILGYSSDYFKDCVAAYNVIQKRSEREPFQAHDFHKLSFLVHKCRLLLNTIDEEYRIYEETADLSKIQPEIRHKHHFEEPEIKQTVFQRLACSTANSESPKKLWGVRSDSETGLEQAISTNLHKILPLKSSRPIVVMSSGKILQRKRKSEVLDEITKNIHLLEKCVQSPNAGLRGDAIIMLREMKGEFKTISEENKDE